MTMKRGFKKVVRTRMLATGESYSVARAKILSSDKVRCVECGQYYTEGDEVDSQYYDSPYDYWKGCHQYCLACWLGVGPKDIARTLKEIEQEETSQS